jgi:hypothetical protein
VLNCEKLEKRLEQQKEYIINVQDKKERAKQIKSLDQKNFIQHCNELMKREEKVFFIFY